MATEAGGISIQDSSESDSIFSKEFRSIWFVGGGVVSAECLRLGLADEVRYSILPILIGDGIQFFEKLNRDVALHLMEIKAYRNGMAAPML